MNVVPIVFAFDKNMVMPARICISSLLQNAFKDTFYDIFILHGPKCDFTGKELDELISIYRKNSRVKFMSVSGLCDSKYEIRGITTATYYRLLIPGLIPEYDKVIYSDVDVIFRSDLWNIYNSTNMEGFYVAGVNSLSHLESQSKHYYETKLRIDPRKAIYDGNMIVHSKLIREDGLEKIFVEEMKNKYLYQEMDIINKVCAGRIKYLPPFFCYTTNFDEYALYHRDVLLHSFSEEEIKQTLDCGIVHYNGAKPWNGYCSRFDIWWEYYRSSIYFDRAFYYDFFSRKAFEYDTMPLLDRLKILYRYFRYKQYKHHAGRK